MLVYAPLDLIHAGMIEIEGLSLEENREVALRRREALAATGRLELNDSAMRLLAQTFVAEFGEFLPEAVDAFYALRDELPASIPDEEIVDELVATATCLGGNVEGVDIPDLARELRNKDDSMSHYSITDDAGHAYCWDPQQWNYDEFALGWDGERWEADYGD